MARNFLFQMGRVTQMKRVPLLRLGLALTLALFVPALSFAQHYIQTNLVTDGGVAGVTAAHTDAHLKNPWGLARSTSSPWWVSDNITGVSTLYDGTGVAKALIVTIPGPKGSPANFVAAPTGVV